MQKQKEKRTKAQIEKQEKMELKANQYCINADCLFFGIGTESQNQQKAI